MRTEQAFRLAVFEKALQPLTLCSRPIPAPAKGEILVKVTACTICGSDLHTFNGKRKEKTPTVLGHEIVGTVQQLGTKGQLDGIQRELQDGDRITWSICVSCGKCDRCQNGIPQKCSALSKIGHEQLTPEAGYLGGFAEYLLLPAQSSVFKLDNDLPDEVVCPANCATATVVAAFARAPSCAGRSVLVIGAGLLGLTACAFAKANAAGNLTVVEPEDRRRKFARDFGADRSMASLDELNQLSDQDRQFDLLLDFSGATEPIQKAINHANYGAHLVLVGSVAPGPAIALDPELVVRRLMSIHGVHNYRPVDLAQAIEFLKGAKSQFPFAKLVESSFPLEKINDAIQYANEKKPIRVMIRP